jgi:hypothetical protein
MQQYAINKFIENFDNFSKFVNIVVCDCDTMLLFVVSTK